MIYTYPDYYKKFKCSADKCSDTCCLGWQIVIDEKSLKKYRNQDNFPSIRLNEYIDFKHNVFKQKSDRRCMFLMDDNLCLLCKEYGEDALCRTCHLYPRHIEEFENVREITLSVSCPEVAKLVLNSENHVQFITKEDDREEEFDDFDELLYSALCDLRDTALSVLRNRSLPINIRAGIVFGLCHDVDKRLGSGNLFSTGALLNYAVTDEAVRKSREKIETFISDKAGVYEFMHKRFRKLFTLEPIGFSWIDLYTESEYTLYKRGEKFYTKWSEQFDIYMSEKSLSFDIQMEQILIYFIFTYLCGAVYDGNIYGKARLCIYSAYYIKELIKAVFIKNGGTVSEEEIQDIVVRYSRELEHSEINLDRMERF